MKLNRSRAARIGFTTAIILTLATSGLAGERTPLVAIYSDNIGMVSPQGKRLYAVIKNDGTMTYADPTKEKWPNRKRRLRGKELARLREVLRSAQLSKLRGNVLADFHPVARDYQTSLRVSITRDSGIQEFTLVDYAPSSGRDFPPGAKELLCLVDELRRSSYRLTHDCE